MVLQRPRGDNQILRLDRKAAELPPCSLSKLPYRGQCPTNCRSTSSDSSTARPTPWPRGGAARCRRDQKRYCGGQARDSTGGAGHEDPQGRNRRRATRRYGYDQFLRLKDPRKPLLAAGTSWRWVVCMALLQTLQRGPGRDCRSLRRGHAASSSIRSVTNCIVSARTQGDSKGALDNAGLAPSSRVRLKIAACPLRGARITSKPLIVA
jgi:hypothetical protein